MIRYRRRLNESTYENRQIIDGDYMVSACNEFGADYTIRDMFSDLRTMLKHTKEIDSPEEALYLLQSIRNTCNEMAHEAQEVIDKGSRG